MHFRARRRLPSIRGAVAGATMVSTCPETFALAWAGANPTEWTAMATRIDYFDDPTAPAANSMVPSVNVVVTDDAGRILLICRTDNGNWAVPGGAIDLGESMSDAAVRETREETGIDCEITGLVGIFTDPRHVIHYTSNDEVRQEFSIVLTGRAVGGQPTPSNETSDMRWIEPKRLPELPIDRSMRLRLSAYERYLASGGWQHLG